jgi:hypothetical protein
MNRQPIDKWTIFAYYTLDSESFSSSAKRHRKNKVVRISECTKLHIQKRLST